MSAEIRSWSKKIPNDFCVKNILNVAGLIDIGNGELVVGKRTTKHSFDAYVLLTAQRDCNARE